MDFFTLIVAGVIAGIAGVVRGITGFGGAMVMAPPLALLLGPQLAVPVILVLESVAAAPMLMQTRHRVQWKVIGAIFLAACVTVPLGVLALVAIDPDDHPSRDRDHGHRLCNHPAARLALCRAPAARDVSRSGGDQRRDAGRHQHRRTAGDPLSAFRSRSDRDNAREPDAVRRGELADWRRRCCGIKACSTLVPAGRRYCSRPRTTSGF